jgi:ribonuclease HI
MKTLKLDHQLAQKVLSGEKKTTFRLFDDKDLSVNDEIEIIDKVESENPETWKSIGVAQIEEVHQKRLSSLVESDFEGHEPYSSPDQIITTFRNYYGSRVTGDTPVKIVRFNFKSYNQALEESVDKKATIFKELTMYADGGSRGNPGPSASGFALMNERGDILVKKGVYLGITTNNQAEYQSLKLGLIEAKKLQAETVKVFMDSQLVVKQMQGLYKVRNRDLWPIYTSIKDLVTTFKHVTFKHVPRELNKIADGAVNEALDAVLKKK